MKRFGSILLAALLCVTCISACSAPQPKDWTENPPGETDNVSGPAVDSMSPSLTEDETARLVLSAIRQGDMNTVLNLCAVEEFVDSYYVPVSIVRQMSNQPLISLAPLPEYDAASRSLAVLRYRAAYASDWMASLYAMVKDTVDVDFTVIDRENMETNAAEQAVAYEGAMRAFDFSKIQVEHLVKTSDLELAVINGWIDESFLDLEEVMPMLKELGAPSSANSAVVYYAILSYEGACYGLALPLFHYEDGWRIQRADGAIRASSSGAVISPLVGSGQEAAQRLGAFSGIEYRDITYDRAPAWESDTFAGAEDAVRAFAELWKQGDFSDLASVACVDQYIEQVDLYQRSLASNAGAMPESIQLHVAAWVDITRRPFPTAAEGFSALSEAMFLGCDGWYAYELDAYMSRCTGIELSKSEKYEEYAQSFCYAMECGVWPGFPADMTAEEAERNRDVFPQDILEEYFDLREALWGGGLTPVAAYPAGQLPDALACGYAGESWLYHIILESPYSDIPYFQCWFLLTHGETGYRISNITMLTSYLEDDAMPADDLIHLLQSENELLIDLR